MFDCGDIDDNGDCGNNGLGGENKDRMLHHARVSNMIEGYREDYDVGGSIEVRVDSVDNCKRYRIDFDYRNMGTLKHRSDCIIALPDCGFWMVGECKAEKPVFAPRRELPVITDALNASFPQPVAWCAATLPRPDAVTRHFAVCDIGRRAERILTRPRCPRFALENYRKFASSAENGHFPSKLQEVRAVAEPS